jgi:glycosyltransferase involved in cell wall biosynthesis
MAALKKILCIPNWKGWYVEAHAEYLKRYLPEFFMEIEVPQDGSNNPFMRNPDDFDLLWAMWPGAWLVDKEKYAHKMAQVFYCPWEGPHHGTAVLGASTPLVERSCKDSNVPFHSLRFGIDTDLFAPYEVGRCCSKLHVGYIGNHANVRHMIKDVLPVVAKVSGIHLMIFPSTWKNNGGTWTDWAGDELYKYIVTGDKLWTGLPNIYNSMDVLLRMDADPAYSFPTIEAAACGVPVIATNSGIDHLFEEEGAAMLIDGNREYYMNYPQDVAEQVAINVEWLRDHPSIRKEMGQLGRNYALRQWTWPNQIDAWREFFKEGLKNAAIK